FTDIVKLERLDDGTYEFHGYYPYGVLLHLPIRQENLVPRFIIYIFQLLMKINLKRSKKTHQQGAFIHCQSAADR
ncbi:MAG: hypothetical protein KAX67_07260, partial [Pararheinheimera sp.]|nr:hypothetical protein [Rheinheimera sp.]